MFDSKILDRFFWAARERYVIHVRRESGWPRERWTDDPAFKEFFFCNLYRELDRTTVAFREQIRDQLRGDPEVLLATVAWRWFNRAETGAALCESDVGLWEGRFSSARARESITRVRGNGPYVTGAFVVKTPDGMSKLDGVLWCIDQFALRDWQTKALAWDIHRTSLQEAHAWLTESPYLGDFMAYEVVTDLRHTSLLCEAPDIMTWANPGPGAMRGLCRLLGEPLESRSRNRKADYRWAIGAMQELLRTAHGRDELQDMPRWEMREVEHWLCEFDKYERACSGDGRMKRVFRPQT